MMRFYTKILEKELAEIDLKAVLFSEGIIIAIALIVAFVLIGLISLKIQIFAAKKAIKFIVILTLVIVLTVLVNIYFPDIVSKIYEKIAKLI